MGSCFRCALCIAPPQVSSLAAYEAVPRARRAWPKARPSAALMGFFAPSQFCSCRPISGRLRPCDPPAVSSKLHPDHFLSGEWPSQGNSVKNGAAAHGASPRLLGCIPAGKPCPASHRPSRCCLGVCLFQVFGCRPMAARKAISIFVFPQTCGGRFRRRSARELLLPFSVSHVSAYTDPPLHRVWPADQRPCLRFCAVCDG
jgi:hypothetical protein